MEGATMIWAIMIVTGFATFLMRFSMFSRLIHRALPPALDRYLTYVPIAVLSAIIAASVFISPETQMPTIWNTRVLAAVLAMAVAFRTKSVIATLIAGLGALWVLENLF
jgi:branched-subunit amino acid transport protein